MKTIIADSYLKEKIFRDLASSNNGTVTGVEILSFNSFLNEEKDNKQTKLLEIAHLLKDNSARFPIYAEMFKYPAFIEEIYSFVKDVIIYDVDLDLPARYPNEEELKEIVKLVLTLDFKEKEYAPKRKEILKKDLSKTVLYRGFYDEVYLYDLLDAIKDKLHVIEYSKNNPNISLRYALNVRQEIEAVVQDIIKNNKSANIVLSDYNNQYPVLKLIFKRYNVPFSSIKDFKHLHIPSIFSSLVLFGYKKDKFTFLNCLKKNAFGKSCSNDIYEFLQTNLVDLKLLDLEEALKDSPFDNEINQNKYLYKKTKEYLDSISASFDLLLNSKSAEEILVNAYEILKASPYLEDQDELKNAISIKTFIQDNHSLINLDDLSFVAEMLEKDEETKENYLTDYITVTDLTHPVSTKQVTYVLNCTASNYPNFKTKSGLFDEFYYANLKNFPSMERRYEVYTSQLSWLDNSAKDEVIYSYPTNDFEGRKNELAYLIETKNLKVSKWSIDSLKPTKSDKHSLDATTANALFNGDGYIHGSISRIERWFNCPYSYFLESGLKIRNNDVLEPSAAPIGTIQHAVFEKAVKEFKKDYTSLTKEKLTSILDPFFDSLLLTNPNIKEQLLITKERMINSLINSLEFLKEYESHSLFTPDKQEQKFEKEIFNSGVKLKGIIDRVDFYSDYFKIVDYKSSEHKLEEKKIRAGLQLQLLTYLFIAEKEFDKKPAGCYYYSVKDEDIKLDAYTSKCEQQEISEEEIRKAFIDKRTFKGVTLIDEYGIIDDSNTFVKSLNKKRDLKLLRETMEELYLYFKENLLTGDITLNPKKDACKFCDYKSICRFNSECEEIEPVVKKETKLWT